MTLKSVGWEVVWEVVWEGLDLVRSLGWSLIEIFCGMFGWRLVE